MPRDLADLDWPVLTQRLSIRPAVAADAAATYAYHGRQAVSQWLTTWPPNLQEWERHLAVRMAHQLVVERDGVLIGDLQLDLREPWSQHEVRDQAAGTLAEIGYTFDPEYAGQGYATEAGQALLRIAFDGVGVRRVIAKCSADNEPSWRLMERLGMRREERSVKAELMRTGEWVDAMTYALLRDEWLAAAD
jgi:RimJ/RimL family protein N-acetyltransferase